MGGFVYTTQRKSTTLQYEITGELETGSFVHNWIAGLEYLSISNDNDRFSADWTNGNEFAVSNSLNLRNGAGVNSSGNPTVNNYSSTLKDKTLADVDVLSFYINDEISLTDSLDLILGARFDNMGFDVIDAKGGATSSDSDDTISPKVGLIYDATDSISVYASYSESFTPKAGDQYAKLSDNADKTDPDTFENTEFGLRYDLPLGLSLSAAYFEIEKNAPSYDSSGLTTSMVNSEISGYELQLSGNLTDRWFLSAGYTNLDEPIDSKGYRLKETPESAFSIWNNFAVNDRLALNLGVIYQDSSLITGYKKEVFYTETLPDYTRVDAGATYALSENTSIQLNIENLTDELYFPHAHGIHQASVGAPINAMLSITSKF